MLSENCLLKPSFVGIKILKHMKKQFLWLRAICKKLMSGNNLLKKKVCIIILKFIKKHFSAIVKH